MTDIIARAQKLAGQPYMNQNWWWEKTLHQDQDIFEILTQGIGLDLKLKLGETDTESSAAQFIELPNFTQALAEETWEYGVQSRELDPIDGWLPWTMTITFDEGRSLESCLKFIEGRTGHNFEYRPVRRRVSPTEVVG